MAVFSLAAPDAPGLRRNLSFDLTAAMGVGMTTALVATLLPTAARREGLSPLGLAVLAAAPFVGNLLGVMAGRFGPRSPRQLAATRALGAGSLVLLVVFPSPVVMALVAVAFWLTLSFSVPFQMRLWGVMYPQHLWGRLVGTIGAGRAAAAGIAALSGGLIADRPGGVEVVALGGLVGAICALGAGDLRAPVLGKSPSYSIRGSLRTLLDRPALAHLTLAQAFAGGGLIAAMPLFVLVQVDRLSLSLAEVGLIGILSSAATTASYVAWGAIIDRRGGHIPLQLGSALGVVSQLAYAVAPAAPVLWIAAVCVGLANAAIDIGIQRSISDHTTLDERAPAMAGWNALTGARGVAAPFLVTGLVSGGVLSVTSGLLLCAAASAVGAVLYVRAGASEGRVRATRLDAAEPSTA